MVGSLALNPAGPTGACEHLQQRVRSPSVTVRLAAHREHVRIGNSSLSGAPKWYLTRVPKLLQHTPLTQVSFSGKGLVYSPPSIGALLLQRVQVIGCVPQRSPPRGDPAGTPRGAFPGPVALAGGPPTTKPLIEGLHPGRKETPR